MFEDIRVKNILDDLYRQHGRTERARGSNSDTDSKCSMEMVARRKALRGLPYSERSTIEKAVRVLEEETGLKQDAALGLLMSIGIFINACERRLHGKA